MPLYLARHGNTFGPNDKVTWVGKQNDLSLVEKGFEQAGKLAEHFLDKNISPSVIFVSPLLRTQQFAETIINKLDLSITPIVDERLNEIDYGNWSGLENAEIIEQFGDHELNSWNNASTWPLSAGWSGSEQEIKNKIMGFTNELKPLLQNQTVLVVSSNGVLRYFLHLIEGEFERRVATGNFKMGTGCLSKISPHDDKHLVEFWNKRP